MSKAMRTLLLFILLSTFGYGQLVNNPFTRNETSSVVQIVRDSLATPLKKIYGVITNGSVTTWDVFGFTSDATYSISTDTLIVTDASGELNFEGLVLTNNQDYTIVGTPTTSQLKIEWGGFIGKTISFIWQFDTLSTAFVEYSGGSVSDKLDKTAFGDSLGNYYFSGTATISISEPLSDSIIVTHGCGFTPLIKNIYVTPQTTTFGYPYWVQDVTSTTFKIKLSDTGLETRDAAILFSWQIRKP